MGGAHYVHSYLSIACLFCYALHHKTVMNAYPLLRTIESASASPRQEHQWTAVHPSSESGLLRSFFPDLLSISKSPSLAAWWIGCTGSSASAISFFSLWTPLPATGLRSSEQIHTQLETDTPVHSKGGNVNRCGNL